MRPAKNNIDILIIGGGASGLAAACICAQQGVPTLLLEKQARVGRKLLATGNGRCNLMPAGTPVFFGDAAFAHQVLSHISPADVRAFFEGLGLVFKEEDGRMYPACGQAAAVLAAQAVRENTGVMNVDMKGVYEILRQHRAIVPG